MSSSSEGTVRIATRWQAVASRGRGTRGTTRAVLRTSSLAPVQYPGDERLESFDALLSEDEPPVNWSEGVRRVFRELLVLKW